jgi:branched-chain amino acid transport system permease protein
MLVGKGFVNNFWLVLGTAVVVTGLVSAVFGSLSLRTHGVYFSFITLSFSELLRSWVLKWTKVTGGENGLTGIRRPFALDEASYYYLVLAGFVVCFFLMKWLMASWFGKILDGIRENESRILMLGYNTWAYKYFAFIIAGIIAGIGGLLSAYYYGIAAPDHFSLLVTGNFLLGTLIGGKRTLFGPVLGTAVVVGSNNYISTYTEHWLLIEGAMFILVVMFFKKGIVGYIQEWWKR